MSKQQTTVFFLFVVSLAMILSSTWVLIRWPELQAWVSAGVLLFAGLALVVAFVKLRKPS